MNKVERALERFAPEVLKRLFSLRASSLKEMWETARQHKLEPYPKPESPQEKLQEDWERIQRSLR